jgi:hypothetical protein
VEIGELGETELYVVSASANTLNVAGNPPNLKAKGGWYDQLLVRVEVLRNKKQTLCDSLEPASDSKLFLARNHHPDNQL